MKISVIISTYNNPLWLEKVIWGYELQTHKNFEFIIADDGSGEETRTLIQYYQRHSSLKSFMYGILIMDFKSQLFLIRQ